MRNIIDRKANIILVTGDREWDDLQTMYMQLDIFSHIRLLIHGNARGADLMAEDWAKSRAIPYLGIPAKWAAKSKAAGPIRNSEMLAWIEIVKQAQGPVVVIVQVLAFHKSIKKRVKEPKI